jgi:hypothetical protein
MASNGTLFDNATLLREDEVEDLGSMLGAKATRQ